MCDYSLQHVASRPAKIGDVLVTARFAEGLTGGFSGVGEPNVAVCVLPGTEIAFDQEIERYAVLPLFRSRKLGTQVARFRRVNENIPSVHHDALELPGGKTVLLTLLRPGQRAKVLQLPADTTERAEARDRAHQVFPTAAV
jgi:hypothetical protein